MASSASSAFFFMTCVFVVPNIRMQESEAVGRASHVHFFGLLALSLLFFFFFFCALPFAAPPSPLAFLIASSSSESE